MPEDPSRPEPNWEDWLDEATRSARPEAGNPFSVRRSLSVLPEAERDALDSHLSGTLNEDESEAIADCLVQLEDLLRDRPRALELLEHIRHDVARTALRCIEESYRFGKRRGQKEALDMILPYARDLAASPGLL